jgi:hypothetical protein
VKTFERGQAIEFQRDPGAPWEPGRYIETAKSGLKWWHWATDQTSLGRSHLVPARRIRVAPAPGGEGSKEVDRHE